MGNKEAMFLEVLVTLHSLEWYASHCKVKMGCSLHMVQTGDSSETQECENGEAKSCCKKQL